MNEFKQISTTTVWELKKQWNINDEKKANDVKKLHYGLFSGKTIIAFTCISIKNNEIFFAIYENDTNIYTPKIIRFLIKKATLLNITKLSCEFKEEDQFIYKKYKFEKLYSSKYNKDLFVINLKK